MAKVIPTGDNIVVEPVTEEVSASGIIIPDTASKEKPMKGKVVAVGPGKRQENGDLTPIGVAVGDLVIFGQYGGNEVKIDGDEYLILSESDIYGVFG